MDVRTQRKVDNYVGRLGIAALRPAAMVLGAVLRRDHTLTVGKEVVWMKLLGGGSLLIAMPMLLGFCRAHPDVRMVLITTPAVRPFAELMGVFDEYRIIDNRGTVRLLASAFRTWLRTIRADCIVDLEVHSRLTTVFTTLTLARNRVSFWLEDIFWRRGLASHLVFFNRASGSFHFYDRIADLFGVAIASRTDCRDAVLEACGIAEPAPPAAGQVAVGFACSDLAQERMLTPAQWVRVFRDNVRPVHRAFLFLGGPNDAPRAEEIIEGLRPEFPSLQFRNCCGEGSLAQSSARIVESSEFWGIDSGLLHIARIAGLPTVSYWGPTDPSTLLRPTWKQGLHETIHYRKIACSPCVHVSEEAPCRGDNRCIKGLFDPGAFPITWTPIEYPPPRASTRDFVHRVLAASWRNVGFICVAASLTYCVVSAFDPPRLNWGDSASDYNAMTAGRNFQKYGFLKLRLTPIVLDPAVMTSADKAMIYTHYPQLPDLMNGLLRAVLGLTDLVQFRFVALAFSFGAFFFIYPLASSYWSPRTAQLALALWVVNPLWLQHADYLHHAPYAAFFGSGALYFLMRYLRDERRRWFLAASGTFVFLTFMSSYDFWFFIPLLIAMMTVGHYRAVRAPTVRVLGVLGSWALVALLFKWSTNAWALGGVGAWWQDMRFQVIERASEQAVKVRYVNGIWPTLSGRVERCFTLLLFPITAFWMLAPVIRRRWKTASPSVNPVMLLLAALPFLVIFTELWVGQYYPTLLVLPFYAVASAAVIVLFLQSHRRLAQGIGVALLAALLANSLDEDLTFKKAFFDRDAIRSLKAQLEVVSPPGQQILVDHVFDAAYRYYFDHNTVALILNPPYHYPDAITYYTDPKRPRVAPPSGAIFVQHKHLADEMYDKGYYYILGRAGLWGPWGNPERYHAELDAFITKRDSELVATVARVGEKVYETDFYAIWRLRPSAAPPPSHGSAADGSGVGTRLGAAPMEDKSHLAKVKQ